MQGDIQVTELYDILSSRFLTPVARLRPYGLARKDPNDPTKRLVEPDLLGRPRVLIDSVQDEYTCDNCGEKYTVDASGMPYLSQCKFHRGRLVQAGSSSSFYSCCQNVEFSEGCKTRSRHSNEGKLEKCHYIGFVETQPKPYLEPNRHGIFSIDCEMVNTVRGQELARVTVVDHNMRVIYDKLVKPPDRIVDCLTEITGLTESRLDEADVISLKQVQTDLLDMFSSKTILIGHSLEHDLAALKIFHGKFIDTSILYLSEYNRRISLKRLMEIIFDEKIQTGSHDSAEDARAALKLVLGKARVIPVKNPYFRTAPMW